MTGFSERPFAAGTVVGLRSFRVVGQGCQCPMCFAVPSGLYAATVDYPWQPGENRAECAPTGQPLPNPDHRPGAQPCTCGFYAYFGTRNDYQLQCEVSGIIEGYGLVTIGHLGFRAEKARIVALSTPWDLPLGRFGVPIYQSVGQMLAEHPTTKPEDVGINPADYPEPPVGRLWFGSGTTVYRTTTAAFGPVGIQALSAATGFTRLKQGPEDDKSPLERKKAAAEAAAKFRQQAKLRNSGGFDRRGRRR